VTRRALLAIFAFFLRRSMPTYPNQYDASVLPYTHTGTLDNTNPDQIDQPERISAYPFAEEQFFIPLTPGLEMQIEVTFHSEFGYELVTFYPNAFDHWYGWYIVAPTLMPDGIQRDYFRWTVPLAGVDANTRLCIRTSAAEAVNYTIRISVVGTDTGGGSGSGYGAF
jgi:hypothetical protein